MGLRPYDRSDFENDLDFMEEAREQMQEYGRTLESVIDDYISGYYEDDFANIETELNKHNFQYYHITIKPGYYEGFTLDIENNFPVAFDGWGWFSVRRVGVPGITIIKAAIKEMREEVKTIPTWAQYERAV